MNLNGYITREKDSEAEHGTCSRSVQFVKVCKGPNEWQSEGTVIKTIAHTEQALYAAQRPSSPMWARVSNGNGAMQAPR